MRYYTPTIFSFLSPAAFIFYVITMNEFRNTATAAAGLLPDAVTGFFGGKEVLAGLVNMLCEDFFRLQLIFLAAVIISLPVVNIVFAAKGKLRPKSLAVINLLLKLMTIPMYILLMLAPVIAIIGSVWGIGIAMGILILTLVAVVVAAFFSIPAVVSSAHYKKIGKGAAFALGFFSFVPVIDVVMAIVITVFANKKTIPPPPVVQTQ